MLFACVAAATSIALLALLGLSDSVSAFIKPALHFLPADLSKDDHPNTLESLALNKVLNDASPVFGSYVEDEGEYSTWYGGVPGSISNTLLMIS